MQLDRTAPTLGPSILPVHLFGTAGQSGALEAFLDASRKLSRVLLAMIFPEGEEGWQCRSFLFQGFDGDGIEIFQAVPACQKAGAEYMRRQADLIDASDFADFEDSLLLA